MSCGPELKTTSTVEIGFVAKFMDMIGAWAGAISSTTAIFWTWGNLTGRLPEPSRVAVPAIEEDELIAEPPVAS